MARQNSNRGVRQLELVLPAWGGKRRGAGRKRAAGRRGVEHATREQFEARPVHVTLRCVDGYPTLRSRSALTVLVAAIRDCSRPAQASLFACHDSSSFGVVHFSVQSNHVHLIVEASDAAALSRGMNRLACRLGKRLNALHRRAGAVFADRFHEHVLATPAEVRNAVRYAVDNAASHTRRDGYLVDPEWRDPYSSSAFPDAVAQPRTWLLRQARLAAA